MKKVIIIGGGLSGLTSGIYLLEKGYKVTILEKNSFAGGLCFSYIKENSLIDMCFHWMTGTNKDSNVYKIWNHIDALKGIEIYHPNSFYQIKYNDKKITLYRDYNLLSNELLKYALSDNDKNLINELLKAIKDIGMYEANTNNPIDFESFEVLKNNIRLLLKFRKFVDINLIDYANQFDSEEIKFLLTNGMVDKNYSVFYFILTLGNFILGNASLPLSSSKTIVENILNRFISLGGEIIYDSLVNKINTKENKILSVVANEIEYQADYFISSIDIHYLYENLLKIDNPYKDKYDVDQKYKTYSYISLIFKVNKDLSDEELETIVLDKDNPYCLFNREINNVCIRQFSYLKYLNKDNSTTVEIFITTYDKDYSIFKSMSNDEYKLFKGCIGKYYLDYLKNYYKTENIKLLDIITPISLNRYFNSYKGTFMTYPLGPKMTQYISNHLVKEFSNLVLGGQWLTLPGGTPIAIINGKFAADTIIKIDSK